MLSAKGHRPWAACFVVVVVFLLLLLIIHYHHHFVGYAPDKMFQKLASECFEAVDWNAEASGDELEQPSSSLVVKHRHVPPEPLKVPPEPLKVPPEPLHDRRLRAACLQSSVATPVFNVDAAHAAHHYLPVTST